MRNFSSIANVLNSKDDELLKNQNSDFYSLLPIEINRF